MTYKIYSYSNNTTICIEQFQNFTISPVNHDEFIISKNDQKTSVKLGEIFNFYDNKYFIFNSQKLTFLYENNKKTKFSLFFCDYNKTYATFKFKAYRPFIVFLLSVFYITQLFFLDY